MSGQPRRARVKALAKINLGLKVLNKRPDGFHELRTVFQTISLVDTIDLEFTPARRTAVSIRGMDIPANLMERAARLALDAMRITGRVEFGIDKRIPMGAGLGGGSSDAAAVLLALPALAAKPLPLAKLLELGAALGSDVPFFLLGGRAVAVGRGTELYPLPDGKPAWAVVVAPGVHISTPEAYRALRRKLTSGPPETMISSFQSCVWRLEEGSGTFSPGLGGNDFESAVFPQHPRLRLLRRQLERLGAQTAMLSGSGSALFGIFPARPDAVRAAEQFREERVFPVSLVSRARYRRLWWRCLEGHIREKTWPPQSRYAKWTLSE